MKENIKTLFIEELRDIYSAEQQIVKSLPDLIEAAESQDLKDALSTHLGETEEQISRLEEIFESLKESAKGETCEAMKGLVEEAQKVVKKFKKSFLRDAAIIAQAQKIEHYEIASYGTLRTFADELGLDNAYALLQETLDEEGHADKLLTKIAEGGLLTSGVNRKANQ